MNPNSRFAFLSAAEQFEKALQVAASAMAQSVMDTPVVFDETNRPEARLAGNSVIVTGISGGFVNHHYSIFGSANSTHQTRLLEFSADDIVKILNAVRQTIVDGKANCPAPSQA